LIYQIEVINHLYARWFYIDSILNKLLTLFVSIEVLS